MSRREDDKIISLEQRREQEAERKRAKATADRQAARRRELAERGPMAVRSGRLVGRILFGLVLTCLFAAVAYWLIGLLR